MNVASTENQGISEIQYMIDIVKNSNTRYTTWIDLFWALQTLLENSPQKDTVVASKAEVERNGHAIIDLAAIDLWHWVALRNAVLRELEERKLVDPEGRVCR